MKRTWTIIGVGDVLGSCKSYQSLLGHADMPPAHEYFGQLLTRTERSCYVSTSGEPTNILP